MWMSFLFISSMIDIRMREVDPIKRKNTIRLIAANGVIAALYVVLTLITSPIAYSYMQFRVSELLCLLTFFNPWYTFGLTLGCLLANLFSTVGPLDIAMGTAATLIACLMMILCSKFVKILAVNAIFPCLVNAAIVPAIIYLSTLGTESVMLLTPGTYFMMFGWVFLGEFLAIYGVGYPIFMILRRTYPNFEGLVLATQNADFKW